MRVLHHTHTQHSASRRGKEKGGSEGRRNENSSKKCQKEHDTPPTKTKKYEKSASNTRTEDSFSLKQQKESKRFRKHTHTHTHTKVPLLPACMKGRPPFFSFAGGTHTHPLHVELLCRGGSVILPSHLKTKEILIYIYITNKCVNTEWERTKLKKKGRRSAKHTQKAIV